MVTETLGEAGSPVALRRDGEAARLLLLPAAALADEAAAVRALAGAAVAPNPFLLPEFLGPAMRAFGRDRVELMLIRAGSGLSFFAPVVAGRWRSGSFPRLRVWTHPFAPLGQPLVRRTGADETAAAIAATLRETRSSLAIPDAPLSSPDLALLRVAAEAAGGRVRVAAPQQRPILRADDPAGGAALDRRLGRKRRKEMARQLRRLGEQGAVTIDEVTLAPRIPAAIATFAALEASGWKGRAGTAMAQDPAVRAFAVEAIRGLAAQGNAAIDIMRAGERPVAALIRLMAGGLAVPWKIAFDETASAFSPGAQLMAAASRQWLDAPAVARVDPVCAEGNALLAHFWPDSEPYGTLYLDFGRTGLHAAASAAIEDGRRALRTSLRRLLARPLARARRRPH